MLIDVLKLLVMPPLCLYLLALAGLALLRRKPRLGLAFLAAGLGLLIVLSMPLVAISLQLGLQGEPTRGDFDVGDAQAIVVLGADANPFAPEYGGKSVGPTTLERLRYGAALARRSGLPILVTAGLPGRDEPALAPSMAAVLEDEFGVRARWVEPRAADTRENAQFSAEILKPLGLTRIVLVTHAWHLPRALGAFEAAGLDARGAGTGWREFGNVDWRAWVPSARGLRESSWAIHEWIGRLWYAIS
jgi:uncharacterized SAM-binding protein YcdF (DUF218 family)